jgi:3-dehydroquinate dehydratase/shikimate dehydrogenase
MTTSRVCVAVTGRTMTEIRARRDAVEGADLVEMRLDTVDRPDAAGALEGRRTPVIVTCRAQWEGGYFTGAEEERRRILEEALALGADFVDVEARAAFAAEMIRARQGRSLILSSHIFGPMPSDLEAQWAALVGSGAAIAKLAVEAQRLSDTLRLMTLAGGEPDSPNAGAPGRVLIAMGDAGVASRILATRIGNAWTYAGDNVAPGQLALDRLLNEFRFRDLNPRTAVYGVVGNPIMHSLSPVMHNAGFRCLGIDAVYLPLQAADAADFVRFAKAMGMAGASITAPFKIALMESADELDPLATRVGAINTLAMRGGRWHGYNTDVHGFAAPLIARLRDLPAVAGRNLRASLLGAGGAARAVAVALAELAGGTVGTLPPAPGSWDVLVNSTSSDGDAALNSPMAGAPLDGQLVYELLYAPPVTRLLADARAAGCTTIGGLEMLVAQAEKQFEIWTGETPPAGLFRQAAEQTLL